VLLLRQTGRMQRDCYQRKADEAKDRNNPGGGRHDGGRGGGPQACTALAYTASAGQPGFSKAHGSTSGSSIWVFDSRATNHMAAGDKSFTGPSYGCLVIEYIHEYPDVGTHTRKPLAGGRFHPSSERYTREYSCNSEKGVSKVSAEFYRSANESAAELRPSSLSVRENGSKLGL